MRKFFENKLAFVAIAFLFTLALAWNIAHGAETILGTHLLMAPAPGGAHVTHGPLPPCTDCVPTAVKHGPLPPCTDCVRTAVKHGPLPPCTDCVRTAVKHGPLPPCTDCVRTAVKHGPLPPCTD